jgi:hypothetical protein
MGYASVSWGLSRLRGKARHAESGLASIACHAMRACRAREKLADFFSILSERMYLKMPLGKVTVPGWIARSLTGCRRVPIMPRSSVSVLSKE